MDNNFDDHIDLTKLSQVCHTKTYERNTQNLDAFDIISKAQKHSNVQTGRDTRFPAGTGSRSWWHPGVFKISNSWLLFHFRDIDFWSSVLKNGAWSFWLIGNTRSACFTRRKHFLIPSAIFVRFTYVALCDVLTMTYEAGRDSIHADTFVHCWKWRETQTWSFRRFDTSHQFLLSIAQ